jgi:Fe2+ or Zn2+ uptake regulation protein
MSTEIDSVAATRLAAAGQRYTASRKALVASLAEASRPLSIPELLAVTPDVPQSSAYRNLAILEQVEVVRKVVATDEFTRFELAEDLTHHHHHLLCTGCGDVRDFTLPERTERSLDKTLAEVASAEGFELAQHRVDVVGLCADCAA